MTYTPEARVAAWLAKHLRQEMCALDAGCGIGCFTTVIAERVEFVDAVDAHAPYLKIAQAHTPAPNKVYFRHGELPQWLTPFPNNSWDVACCIDMLEHLEIGGAQRLLAELKRVAKMVLIFTPEGPMPQDTDAWGLGGEYWQTHRSIWQAADLEAEGFVVERWVGFHEGPPAGNALAAVWSTP